MATHRYQVGERVQYVRSPFDGHAASGVYTITRLMPADGQDPVYRVKSANEAHERTMAESQLDKASLIKPA